MPARISLCLSRAGLIAALMAAVSHSQAERTVKFITLQVAVESDVAEPSTRVFQTEKDWNEFLQENAASFRGRQSIDFSKQTVAAIFAGQKPTGGYAVQVTKVIDESRPGPPTRGVLHYRLVSPPPDALVTQVLTYPYVVIRIDKKFDEIEFNPLM
jgi:hypothetical protein